MSIKIQCKHYNCPDALKMCFNEKRSWKHPESIGWCSPDVAPMSWRSFKMFSRCIRDVTKAQLMYKEGPNSNKIVFEKNRKKAYTFFVLMKESCKVQGTINMWFCIYESIFGLILCYHGNVMGLFPSWSWALLPLTYLKNVGMLELAQ